MGGEGAYCSLEQLEFQLALIEQRRQEGQFVFLLLPQGHGDQLGAGRKGELRTDGGQLA